MNEQTHVLIGYDKINNGRQIKISEAVWPKFEELIKKGGESLGIKIVLEDNQDPITNYDGN